MNLKKIKVDADYAKNLLTMNISNRPVDLKRVSQYAIDMKNGNWKEDTAELIKVSKKGRLMDGQHRLLAVIKSNCSINFHICYDLDEVIFDVIDTGKTRGAKDVFSIAEIPNYAQASSILRRYKSFCNGKFYKGETSENLSNSALLNEYQSKPQYYAEIVKMSLRLKNSNSGVLDATSIGAFICLFSDINKSSALDFISQLCLSTPFTNIQIELLQKTLLRDRLSSKKMSSTMKYAFIIKSWNNFRLQKTNKILKWDSSVESFPIPL